MNNLWRTFLLSTIFIFLCKPLTYADTYSKLVETGKIKDYSARIDKVVAAINKKNNSTHLEKASDEVFLRRVYLDLTGKLPTYEESQAFMDSTDAKKREQLISKLLQSDYYVAHFYNYWASLLRVQTIIRGMPDSAYEQWIKAAIKNNMPYNVFVSNLVAATGSASENGATGYQIRDREVGVLDHVSMTSTVFLASQIGCAMCHNAKFEKWKQKDFYALTAYFSEEMLVYSGKDYRAIQAKRSGFTNQDVFGKVENYLRQIPMVIEDRPGKIQKLPLSYVYDENEAGKAIAPKPLYGPQTEIQNGQSRRAAFASWLTSPENPNFTRAIANRYWGKLLKIALIEPVDDLNEDNAPSSPELMKTLTAMMVELKYDLKAYVAIIANTQLYQRATSSQPVSHESYVFDSYPIKRLTSEQIWDSMLSIYGVKPIDNPLDKTPVAANSSYGAGSMSMMAGGSMTATAMNASTMMSGSQMMSSSTMMSGNTMMSDAKMTSPGAESSASGNAEKLVPRSDSFSAKIEVMDLDQTMNTLASIYPRVNPKRYDSVLSSDLIYQTGARKGQFLDQFGQSGRETVFEGSRDGSISQALTMMNGREIEKLLNKTDKNNKLSLALLKYEKNPPEAIRYIYWTILTREPTDREMNKMLAYLEDYQALGGLQDISWALFNSREFLFSY